MSYSTSYAPQSSFVSGALDNLRFFLPNLVLSLGISIVGSIVLTGLTYWLNAAIGLPVIPFLFIMI
ncbi:hypothetical protein [Nostoc sp. FACHB-110]|uniref:hypothetical protein n=1 Tax=Nostoc sp. FACHB-110 TaxID=2692834 RepID=UPI001683BF39|nr:hypothetical protein [Nostoc sp. FACHB-110]MBD2440828.1 hypothetical protein [Nostoc sp. FACHB-110]